MYHSFLIHSSADGHLGCLGAFIFISKTKQNAELGIWQIFLCCLLEWGSPTSSICSPALVLKCGYLFLTHYLHDLDWKRLLSFCSTTQIQHRDSPGVQSSCQLPLEERSNWYVSSTAICLITKKFYFKIWKLMSGLKQLLWWWYLWVLYLLFQTRKRNINIRYQYVWHQGFFFFFFFNIFQF